MAEVVIDNPILNSPFFEPARHFDFTDEGISDQILDGRRPSSYFVPIPSSKKRGGKQLAFDTEWTKNRIEENKLVNEIRGRVGLWRRGGYPGVTPVTSRLLEYWTHPDREKKLFFCQIEALETAIYIAEAAKKYGDSWIDNRLRDANNESTPGLTRQAFKMATGSGKTVVMAMLIAWQALNKFAYPQDNRFSDSFLVITPGITIRDRLRVLLPNDGQNYYQQRDIIPPQQRIELERAKILITNFHAFQQRETSNASSLTKKLLNGNGPSPFLETPDQMVRRVCRELGNKRNIVVFSDEAHHCYQRRPEGELERLTREEQLEVDQREKEARIWLKGVIAVKSKIGVRSIYDLSATPFFLRGSGYPEGTLFPWVVSDFSLIDAIEAGIVKVPRVPVADDSMTGDEPTYRGLWLRIRDELPKKGRKTDAIRGEPKLPVELEAALQSLYGNYEKAYRLWESDADAQVRGLTPPVFIVVCNNTNVSKLVFDHISGWETKIGDQTFVKAGRLPIFRNDDGEGHWLDRPNTILVDSQQLESGESMSDDFKRIASREIEEFKADYSRRFPGRDANELTNEDLLREVMNTVGKPERLGEHIRCVVSVSMLTEGWDANTVTHILGVRAFGTQLLCEQVVGRALRRRNYSVNVEGKFEPEYAEVYGVPFSFIPGNGSINAMMAGPIPTRVRAIESRIESEITFPRILGYRFDIGEERLVATFTESSKLALSTYEIPSMTVSGPIVGESVIHQLYDLEHRVRPNQVAFHIARRVVERYFFDEERKQKPWLFPQVLEIAKRWVAECVTLKDKAVIQMLTLVEYENDAADRIHDAIVATDQHKRTLLPIIRPYDAIGSTRHVDFDSTRPVYTTRADKCHISHVVADTDSWEQKLAQTIEDMPEVIRYVKNHNLGFTIPYSLNGEERQYIPDFIACIDDGHSHDDLLSLLIEVSGEKKKDKDAKVRTTRDQWVPAVNNHGGFGRWAFIEVSDPWDAANTIRGTLRALAGAA